MNAPEAVAAAASLLLLANITMLTVLMGLAVRDELQERKRDSR